MPLTLRRLEEIAPDQNALTAAAKLRRPSQWAMLATDPARALAWGECQGSSANPYRLVLDTADLGHRCTCPSRKFPCKHVLALGWQLVEEPGRFRQASAPEWVDEWIARRRPSAARPQERTETVSATAAHLEAAKPAPPEAAAEAAERRQRAAGRSRQAQRERHEAVLEGLAAFERWLLDILAEGAAAVLPELSARCRTIAKRLVDAKAPGLAGRVDELPAEIFQLPDRARPQALLLRLGRLYLLAAAYQRLDRLPIALQADVRAHLGISLRREAILEDPSALRVRGRWTVLCGRTVVQPDALRRVETWLARVDEGDAERDDERTQKPLGAQPRTAVLIDYYPPLAGKVALPFAAGDAFTGELVFYPSVAPLRAVIGAREGATAPGGPLPKGVPLGAALEAYLRDLAVHPWLGTRPLLVADVGLEDAGDRAWLTDGRASIPIERSQTDAVRPLRSLPLVKAAGLWDGNALVLACAHTALGRWSADTHLE